MSLIERSRAVRRLTKAMARAHQWPHLDRKGWSDRSLRARMSHEGAGGFAMRTVLSRSENQISKEFTMFQIKAFTAALVPALVLGAGAALAECPRSTADTADSIYVTFNDFHVRYDLLADGSVIEEEISFEDGTGFRVNSLRGAFVLQSWSTEYGLLLAETSEVTTWDVGAANLPVLAAGQTWSGNSVRVHDDGETNYETVTVAIDPARVMSIGPCTYDAWPMVVTTAAGGGALDFIDYLTYLPSLGIAIYHGGIEEGEQFTSDEPTSISTTPPVRGDGTYLLPGAPVNAGNPTPAQPPAQPSK
jgi:hypothetical protein